MVWVGLLGPLLVVDGEGREVAVPARKERAVLALLALRADRPVRLGELVAALWGDAPPASATKTAQSYVSLLRRRLGADTIEHGPGGYRLRLSADQVDVTRFEAALRAAAEAAAQGQPERVVGLAGEALGLWRGEPLPDLDDQPLGLAEATRLGELRRAGQDGLFEARLALGEHAQLVGALEAAVTAEPLRERRWAQLMVALYRSGRQADALRAYQRLRAGLAEQLGIEPGGELRALEEAILLQKPDLETTKPAPRPEGFGVRPARGSLGADEASEPAQRTSSPGGGVVTFLFSDIEGSTSLWERHPTDMAAVVERHDRLITEAIQAQGGQVFKTVGDAVHAVFAGPVAAVRAALAIQADIAAGDWGDVGPLAVRIGIYTGEAQLVEGEWRGRPLNRCARLRDTAAGGQIVASHATTELVGDDLAGQAVITDLGEQHLRGVTRTERAHQIQARPAPTEPGASGVAEAASAGQSEPLPAVGESNGGVRAGGQLLLEAGRLREARLQFWREADEADRRGDPEALGRAALGLGGVWVHEHRSIVDRTSVLELQRRALAALDPGSNLVPRLRTRLAAEEAYLTQVPDAVLGELDQARRRGDPIALAEALSLAHHLLLGPDHGPSRLALADELVRVSATTQRPRDMLHGLAWRTVDLFLLGDRHAPRLLAELRERLELCPFECFSYLVDALDVMLAIRAGELKDAEQRAEACYARGLDVGDADAVGWYGAHQVAICWFQGRADEVLPIVADMTHSTTLATPNEAFFAALAVLAVAAGEVDHAQAALASLTLNGLASIPRSSNWLATLLGVCEAAHLLGDARTASEAYRLLHPHGGLPVMVSLAISCFGSAHRPLGLAAATTGDLDEAVAQLETALLADLAVGHGPAHVMDSMALADVLDRRHGDNDPTRAAALRTGGVAEARRYDMDARAHGWD